MSTHSVRKYIVAGTQVCCAISSIIKIRTCLQIAISNRESYSGGTAGCVWTRCFEKSCAEFQGFFWPFTLLDYFVGDKVLWTCLGWVCDIWDEVHFAIETKEKKEQTTVAHSLENPFFFKCVQVGEPQSLPGICMCYFNSSKNRCLIIGCIVGIWYLRDQSCKEVYVWPGT